MWGTHKFQGLSCDTLSLLLFGGNAGGTLSQFYQSFIHARIASTINTPTTRNTGWDALGLVVLFVFSSDADASIIVSFSAGSAAFRQALILMQTSPSVGPPGPGLLLGLAQRAPGSADGIGTPDPDPRHLVSWCF